MKCIDEITLNAYFDGELSPFEMKHAAAHLAVCYECTQNARDIEDEIATLSLALEAEISRPVPTERLWARIETAVAELPPPTVARPKWSTRLREWFGALNFVPQQAVAFATLAIMGASVAWFAWSGRSTEPSASVSDLAHNSAEFPTPIFVPATPAPMPAVVAPKVVTTKPQAQPNVVAVKFTPPVRPVAKRESRAVPAPAVTEPAILPDEERYLKSIASLDRALAAQRNEMDAQPGLRATYERNVAVLDQAIKASQRAARRNPKDTDAAEFLYSSYQSKLDLMTTVAAHTRPLVAER